MRMKAVLAAALITALAACAPTGGTTTTGSGSSDGSATPSPTIALEPEVLFALAVENMLDAPSKRLVATASVAGSAQEAEIIYIDDTAQGHKVERYDGFESVTDFVKVDGSLYIYSGEPYWQWYVPLEDRILVVDKWVRVPADHRDHSALLVLTDDSTTPWQPVGELTVDESAGDASTVVLVDSEGSRFTISTGGTPYLVRVETSQESELGPATADIRLSDFGTVTDAITAPPGPYVELQ